jgi:transcription elongation factor Elf1
MTIFRSILITSIVSILFGFALRNIFGFWESIALAFVIQFITAFIYSSLKLNKIDTLTEEFEVELQQLLDLSEATISCPCGNYNITENIFINMENTYVCEKCDNEFKLNIAVTPTLVTQPVDVNQSFSDLSKDVEIVSEYSEGKEL